MHFYHGEQLYAVRKGPFKAHFITKTSYVRQKAKTHDPALLFNLDHDPSEQYNIAGRHPKIIQEIRGVGGRPQGVDQTGLRTNWSNASENDSPIGRQLPKTALHASPIGWPCRGCIIPNRATSFWEA